ncbi:hypothetical protein BO86DRAFT_392604 [Aspergillus japonicus CBS 114.51]|uniref:Uncharacterized protein n=1 Tax=Aspergillus japonicus CBS 114.51 TaxID=1448312 RepID=A0A8T8WNP7_ASPJA|nr:hypothetical protein BO86DRAFT_392604 [Aspergillus japonicus CBS 114.51]RAH77458.1 hypothetical protein BO86DRAFT_392604 [Aspergillus japonicus CBS 114.51]
MKVSLALLATAALTAMGALALPHGNTEMANMNMSTMEDSPDSATQTSPQDSSSSPSSKPSSSSSTPQPSKKAGTPDENDEDFLTGLLGNLGLGGLGLF